MLDWSTEFLGGQRIIDVYDVVVSQLLCCLRIREWSNWIGKVPVLNKAEMMAVKSRSPRHGNQVTAFSCGSDWCCAGGGIFFHSITRTYRKCRCCSTFAFKCVLAINFT